MAEMSLSFQEERKPSQKRRSLELHSKIVLNYQLQGKMVLNFPKECMTPTIFIYLLLESEFQIKEFKYKVHLLTMYKLAMYKWCRVTEGV